MYYFEWMGNRKTFIYEALTLSMLQFNLCLVPHTNIIRCTPFHKDELEIGGNVSISEWISPKSIGFQVKNSILTGLQSRPSSKMFFFHGHRQCHKHPLGAQVYFQWHCICNNLKNKWICCCFLFYIKRCHDICGRSRAHIHASERISITIFCRK